jgi:hypothetical protein
MLPWFYRFDIYFSPPEKLLARCFICSGFGIHFGLFLHQAVHFIVPLLVRGIIDVGASGGLDRHSGS